MIKGVGTDIVQIPRIEKLISEYGDAFLQKTFTSGEVAYAEQKAKGDAQIFAAALAKRWAAKEAVVKALGIGFGNGIYWKDVEIVSGPGAPHVVIHSGNVYYASLSIKISMSDDYPVAVAFAVVSDK